MSVNFNLNNSSQRALDSAIMGCVRDAVQFLADKHGFDATEAFQEMNLVKSQPTKKPKVSKPKTIKPSVPLPFCGTLLSSCCGIRVNHGLHSQCSNAKEICEISGESLDYCKTCGKQAKANDSGAPNAGDIRTRLSGEWTPQGKLVNYGNVMEKLGISREKADEEAAKLGLTIPEDQFIVVKGKRGRPKGDASTSSSDDEKPKRKPGRPRKSKKVLDSSTGDDLIASLVAQAGADSTSSSDSDQEEAKAAEKAAKAAEKAAEKKAKEEAKAAKAAEKAAEKAAAKKAKEEAKAAEKAAAKKAKEEAKAAEKAAAKKAKEEAKAAEKAAAKKAKEEAKAAAKKAKEEESKAVEELTAVENQALAEAEEEESKAVEELTAVENQALEEGELEEEPEGDEEEDADVSLNVKTVEIKGTKYLMDEENNLYDVESHESTGTYYDEEDDEIKAIEYE